MTSSQENKINGLWTWLFIIHPARVRGIMIFFYPKELRLIKHRAFVSGNSKGETVVHSFCYNLSHDRSRETKRVYFVVDMVLSFTTCFSINCSMAAIHLAKIT